MKIFAAVLAPITILLFAACQGGGPKNAAKAEPGDNAYTPEIQGLIMAVHAQPDSNKIRRKLALALDSIGDYANAFKQIDTTVKKDTGNNLLWINRGNIAEDAGDTLAATESYVRAL